jgi:hypothetical protein
METSADLVIVQVNEPVEVPEEEAGLEGEAAPAEPELIGRKEEEPGGDD